MPSELLLSFMNNIDTETVKLSQQEIPQGEIPGNYRATTLLDVTQKIFAIIDDRYPKNYNLTPILTRSSKDYVVYEQISLNSWQCHQIRGTNLLQLHGSQENIWSGKATRHLTHPTRKRDTAYVHQKKNQNESGQPTDRRNNNAAGQVLDSELLNSIVDKITEEIKRLPDY